jgi:hypothetical protein
MMNFNNTRRAYNAFMTMLVMIGVISIAMAILYAPELVVLFSVVLLGVSIYSSKRADREKPTYGED